MNTTLTIILTSAVVSALISGFFLFLNDLLRRKSEEKRFKIEATLKLTKLAHEQLNEVLKYKKPGQIMQIPKVIKTFLGLRKRIDDVWNNKE